MKVIFSAAAIAMGLIVLPSVFGAPPPSTEADEARPFSVRLRPIIDDAEALLKKKIPQDPLLARQIAIHREKVQSLLLICKRFHVLSGAGSEGCSAHLMTHAGYELASAMADLARVSGEKQAAASYLKQSVAYAETWVEAMQAIFDAGIEPGGVYNTSNELWLAIDARSKTKLELLQMEEGVSKPQAR